MLKQRLVFFVALVCIAQLGFVIVTEVNRYVSRRSQQGTAVVSRNTAVKQAPEADRASLKTESSTGGDSRKPPKASGGASQVPTGKEIAQPAALTTNGAQRNPFVPFFSIKQGGSNASTSTPADFELAELRVTAIIKDSQGNYSASVKAPNERNFIVKVGSTIGLHGGRVSSITDSKIIVSESTNPASDPEATTTKELLLKRGEPAEG
jgi:Tfp pilus assembly protein PilP